jgi:hypothetical protein
MTLQALNTILLACTLHLNPQTAHHRQQAPDMERSCRATIIMCVDNKELQQRKPSTDDDVADCIIGRIIHGR